MAGGRKLHHDQDQRTGGRTLAVADDAADPQNTQQSSLGLNRRAIPVPGNQHPTESHLHRLGRTRQVPDPAPPAVWSTERVCTSPTFVVWSS